MARELKGKVKMDVWVRSTCVDDTEFSEGQGARLVFKDDCNSRHEPIDVASPDLIAEAMELGESIDDLELEPGTSEM
jgi:hypothetical protein